MHGFIDPPTPFAPMKDWQDFLAQMQALPQDDPDVLRETREAQNQIAARQQGQKTAAPLPQA